MRPVRWNAASGGGGQACGNKASHLLLTVKQCWFWQTAHVQNSLFSISWWRGGRRKDIWKQGCGEMLRGFPLAGLWWWMRGQFGRDRRVWKVCSAAFRLRCFFSGCGVLGFGCALLFACWRTNEPVVNFECLLLWVWDEIVETQTELVQVW